MQFRVFDLNRRKHFFEKSDIFTLFCVKDKDKNPEAIQKVFHLLLNLFEIHVQISRFLKQDFLVTKTFSLWILIAYIITSHLF